MIRLALLLSILFLTHANAQTSSSFAEKIEHKINHELGLELSIIIFNNQDDYMPQVDQEISDFYVNSNNNTFSLKIRDEAGKQRVMKGKFSEARYMPAYNYNLKKGYELTESDIMQKKVSIDSIKNTKPLELEKIIGKVLAQSVKTGQIITEKELKAKPLINQNQYINIVFIKRNLTIEASGIALESGALGDVIKVKNIDNNKVLKGWVSDENTVTVNKDAK